MRQSHRDIWSKTAVVDLHISFDILKHLDFVKIFLYKNPLYFLKVNASTQRFAKQKQQFAKRL